MQWAEGRDNLVPKSGHNLSRFTRAKNCAVTLLTNGKMELNAEKCEVINLEAGKQIGKDVLNRASFQEMD